MKVKKITFSRGEEEKKKQQPNPLVQFFFFSMSSLHMLHLTFGFNFFIVTLLKENLFYQTKLRLWPGGSKLSSDVSYGNVDI